MANWGELREKRIGVGLHYDGSGSDAGAVAWLRDDPRCQVSYTDLILDPGNVVPIAPWNKRAWHMGICRPSDPLLTYKDANSAFYGLCIAAKPGDTFHLAQKGTMIRMIVGYFQHEGWSLKESWRLTSHHLEAWPRGRKVDIEPLWDINEARAWLERAR